MLGFILSWIVSFLFSIILMVLFDKFRKSKEKEMVWPKRCRDKKVEAVIAQLKKAWSQQKDNSEDEFWRDIDRVVAVHDDIMGSMREWPDRVKQISDKCPKCGTSLVSFYYSYPPIAWKELAGRAGTMTICPKCGKSLSFRLELMS